MVKRVEHIGIAVRDLARAEAVYEALLGVGAYKRETVESEQVLTSFFQAGGTKIELLYPLSESSAIHRFLDKRGEGMHHIAFEVEDIREEMARLRRAGFRLLNEEPKRGADNKLICFVHPKSCHSVLIELCQSVDD